MRWAFSAAAVALAPACMAAPVPGAAGDGSAGGPAPAVRPRGASGGAVEQMVERMNAHRRSVHCPDLVWMQGAAGAAQAHADDMARRGYFAHQSPEGAGPADRLRAQGVGYRAMAENIAHHPGAAREVLQGWLASPGHRSNLERCTYTHHGLGVREGRWVHLFVTPVSAAP